MTGRRGAGGEAAKVREAVVRPHKGGVQEARPDALENVRHGGVHDAGQ